MIRLDNREPVPESMRGAVLALGNFDGFHQGHQAVVGEAIRWARELGRPAIVATFDPHPVRLFQPDAPAFRLTTLDQRQDLFEAAGADAMLLLHFDRAMASMEAADWIEQVLGRQLGCVGVVTGEDFTFGKGRGGNPQVLREVGARIGLIGRTVGAVHDERGVISSSRIRDALKLGECETATRLLTRPFAARGVVQHGGKLGRTIGFPTANIDMHNYLRPRYGIYAVTGRMPDGRVLPGAANMGVRPTFEPPIELLEPYFFDFSGDLYGQEIEVAFHHFLRPEAKFDSLDALVAQMGRDCDRARELLSHIG
ncbi:FMN adenylyltransferase /riboflavin kinase [Novosphingobium sp. PhB57]|jgi:riboflavin kinase/FMN adenylyltransferase|uniref:bifunctional riboflavin kinase/FAD synthetase n=1 Tax=unclassified Novosphingobium TaxID=2644732 RepID=UPI0010F2494F|nr:MULTISPECIES: bifunctional riboflavin kinase/FAD synthetase [unclassified Novosphingobium]TCU59438.1 FMN adenylyltransferase /riboflavin kinase [Novosphingobium sp. PhB57]TDW63909.1 FMN adenylyltransferase /riboflavin kinase [Novosphingobium sp. PhB55]